MSYVWVDYPTAENVQGADVEELLRWNRFLPSPRTRRECAIMDEILRRLAMLRHSAPRDYTEASKRIGWDF